MSGPNGQNQNGPITPMPPQTGSLVAEDGYSLDLFRRPTTSPFDNLVGALDGPGSRGGMNRDPIGPSGPGGPGMVGMGQGMGYGAMGGMGGMGPMGYYPHTGQYIICVSC
jgi:hypothetical protein